VERAKQEASRFKDEAGELKQRQDGLISAARSKIAAADKELSDSLTQDHIPALRAALRDFVCETPDSAFVVLLRGFKDFDVKLSKMEIEALVERSEGNYAALRMLQTVAKKSGFDVSAPQAEDFTNDLRQIEQAALVPMMWAPAGYLHEALEVLPDMPIFRWDGSIAGTRGRPTSTDLLLSCHRLDDVYKGLKDAGERWGSAFVPAISELKDIKNEETEETITPEQQRAEAVKDATGRVDVDDSGDSAVEAARRMGAEAAGKEERARTGLERFMVQ